MTLDLIKILAGYVAQQQRLSRSEAFLDFAEEQTPAPTKACPRATAKHRDQSTSSPASDEPKFPAREAGNRAGRVPVKSKE
jgi:hypothetical protein